MKGLAIIPMAGVVFILLSFQNVAWAEQTLLLDLKYKSDTKVIKEVTFYGNCIDPNHSSTEDRFSVRIDDQPIEVPESIYWRLHQLRRSFSYDELSGGIDQRESSKYTYMLGGPLGVSF